MLETNVKVNMSFLSNELYYLSHNTSTIKVKKLIFIHFLHVGGSE